MVNRALVVNRDRWLITVYESDNPVVRAGFAAHTYTVAGRHGNLTMAYDPDQGRAVVVSRKNAPEAIVAQTEMALLAYAAGRNGLTA